MYPTTHVALLISKTLQSATGNSKQHISDCQMEILRSPGNFSLCTEGLEQTCHLPHLDSCFRRSGPALTGRNYPTGSVMLHQANRPEFFVLVPMVGLVEPAFGGVLPMVIMAEAQGLLP